MCSIKSKLGCCLYWNKVLFGCLQNSVTCKNKQWIREKLFSIFFTVVRFYIANAQSYTPRNPWSQSSAYLLFASLLRMSVCQQGKQKRAEKREGHSDVPWVLVSAVCVMSRLMKSLLFLCASHSQWLSCNCWSAHTAFAKICKDLNLINKKIWSFTIIIIDGEGGCMNACISPRFAGKCSLLRSEGPGIHLYLQEGSK